MLIRSLQAEAVEDYAVEFTVTTDEVIRRDLDPLPRGDAFDAIRGDKSQFRQLRAEGGTVVWPNGADLCPDVVIWGGRPPGDASSWTA